MSFSRSRILAALAATVLLWTCTGDRSVGPSSSPVRGAAASVAAPSGQVLVGAGDIARCDRTYDEATAAILDTIPGAVFTVGDNVLGTSSAPPDFTNCYDPSWGRHKARTRPAVGHMEGWSPGYATYVQYFAAAAGDAGKFYYSYDLGSWHVVVLNSNISMAAGSSQEQWLKADLAAHPALCTIAIWHLPRFSSTSGNVVNASVKPLWDDLYAAGAEIVINAHYEVYERFAPQRSDGTADPQLGIRQFTVGTGGIGSNSFSGGTAANSEVRNSGTPGVLKLTLGSTSYAWQFIPIAGFSFTDAGSADCHGTTPPPPKPSVNAGPDLTTHPDDTVTLTASFADTGANDAPWTYAITWGDGSSSSGTTASTTTPITATHVYSALGLDSVHVTVTNSQARSGADSVAVQVNPSGAVVLVGAGDIADCTVNGDGLTANLLDTIPGTVFALGDNAYPDGSSSNYTNCYGPTWGRDKARTRPAPGNHDYNTSGAAGYFGYFGAAAGDPTKGYYSYDLGDWHIIVLNTNIAHSAGSTQEQWLKADLAASAKRCTLAYWHHPLFSSGSLADTMTRTMWRDLYAVGAEIVLNGHEHNYQRFAPQTPTAVADPATGIREFIVGTGGAERFGIGTPLPNTQVQNDQTFGVLKLTLYSTGYDWRFIPVAGQTFTDAGSGACHDAASVTPAAATGGPYAGAEGAAVSFDGSGSSDPSGTTLTYAWNFGDGSSDTGVKPTHPYASPGSYTVTLTVTNAGGVASAPATTTATIANVAPTVTVGANQTVAQGSPVSLSVTFSDPGVNDGPWAYAFTWGDGSPQTTGSATSQTSPITATHTYTAAGTNTVGVTVTDKGGAAGSGQLTVTVTQLAPPTAAPGGPYAGAEGAAVSFDGSGSSDPGGTALTYAWTFGDGTSDTGVKPTHPYASPGSYTVTLTVTNAGGATSAPATTNATIVNVAPTVTAGANQTVAQGSPVSLSVTFSDPGVTDGPWAYAFTWGDGSPQTTGSATSQTSPITATHTYTAAGTNTVGVTVTDKGGAAGSGQLTVTVTQLPPPTAAPGGPYAGSEATAVSFDGSGSSDPGGTALTYAWTFGDGTSGTGVKPTHTYASFGSYTVTLTVTNAGGATSAPATTNATIVNVAPTVTAGANQTVAQGSPVSLSVTFNDPGVNDGPWAYAFTWGDGSPQTTGSATSQTSPITATHTYSAAGTNTVGVTVTDKGGAAGTGQLTVTVTPPPTAAPGGPYAGSEATAVSFDGSGSSDPGGTALTYAWTFGDGTSGTGVKPTHTYTSFGSYTVTLTVTNARGATSAPATTNATIVNVAPTVTAGANQTVAQGSPVSLSVTFSDPGVTDGPWAYAFTWGDGSPQTTGSATSQTSPITATHTYTAAGTNTVGVTVTDKGGAAGSGQLIVTVTAASPAAVLVGAGDIARCDRTYDEATAAILDTIPGAVFTVGDNVLGTSSAPPDFVNCYDPSWGRHKARTRPAIGHMEGWSPGYATYVQYFGAAAGDAGKFYYSYDLGSWHVVVLNSNISMAAGSSQEQWLRADLTAHPAQCTLAIWHLPRFSSTSGNGLPVVNASVKPLWDDLYAAGAEIVINAHYEVYERFAPQRADGTADPQLGIRQFTVGTGGIGLNSFAGGTQANSEVHNSGTPGVLKLTLGSTSYAWQFIPIAGFSFNDSGTGACH